MSSRQRRRCCSAVWRPLADRGLTNVDFQAVDTPRWQVPEPFDAVVSFDAIDDQADPAGALTAIHRALAPGGLYLMLEPHAASDLAGNLDVPTAPLLYAMSTLHCVPVNLAEGGVALGTMAGTEKLTDLLTAAGFADIQTTVPAPGDPLAAIFVSRKPTA